MKVNIISDGVGEWMAIYKDGNLVHWHDTPSPFDLLAILGIDVEWEEDVYNVLGFTHDSAPATLSGYRERKHEVLLRRKINRKKRIP